MIANCEGIFLNFYCCAKCIFSRYFRTHNFGRIFLFFEQLSFPLCQNIGQYISHCAYLGKEMYLHATDFFPKIVKNFSGGSRISWTGRNIFWSILPGKKHRIQKNWLNGKCGVPDPGGASAESPIITAHKRSLGQGNTFTGVCLTHPPGQTPPGHTPQGRQPPSVEMTIEADGTHPTGMHSCYRLVIDFHTFLLVFIFVAYCALADLGGREGRTPPPGRPNSFDFMQFSGKFGVFTPPLEGSRPPSGKSWIRHCCAY